MAGGFAKDGAVQEQIDVSLSDEINRARQQLPRGESRRECEECGKPEVVIPMLGLNKGDRVADVFGGAGYYSELLTSAMNNLQRLS